MSKKMTMVYVFVHLAVLALLISFVFVAAPTTDDYAFAVAARKNSIWGAMVQMFQGWGGRYIQALVATVWYKLSDIIVIPYYAGLLLFIILLFSGIYFFLKEVFRGVLNNSGVIVASLVVISGLFRGFSTLDESIYWNIGGITYLLPAAVFLSFLALLLYSYRSNNVVIMQPILCMMILFTSGINEAFVIMNVLVMFGFFAYMLWISKVNWIYLVTLVIALVGLGLTVISKGNSARMEFYPQAGQFGYSLLWGGLSGTQAVLQAIVDPYIWGSIFLFLPLFNKMRSTISDTVSVKKLAVVYSLTLLLMLYSTVAIHYYATGNRPVQRLMVVWYIIFILGIIPLMSFVAPTLQKVYSFAEIKFMSITRNLLSMKSALFGLVIVAFLLINNPPKAIYDLAYTIPGFRIEMREYNRRVKELQESSVTPKDFVVEKFKYRPKLLKAPTDVDYGIGPYYGFDSVKIVPRKESEK